MKSLLTLSASCIYISSALDCTNADDYCRQILGEQSFCSTETNACETESGLDSIPCECGIFTPNSPISDIDVAVSVVDAYVQLEGVGASAYADDGSVEDNGTVGERMLAMLAPKPQTSPGTPMPSTTAKPAKASVAGGGVVSCDMHAYCRSVGGPLSYCKSWQTVATCFNADQFENCVTCGATGSSATPTTAVISTAKPTVTSASTRTTTRASASATTGVSTRQTTTTTSVRATTISTKTTAPSTSATTRTTTAKSSPTTTRGNTNPTTISAATSTTGASTRPTTVVPATTTPTTTIRTITGTVGSPAEAGSMFLWSEWPSMWGEPDWIEFYGKLLDFVSSSPLNINRVILRMLDPIYGTVATTPETKHDLWTVSVDSVVFTAFLSKLPSSVKTFDVYPYLMDLYNQDRWKCSMNTTMPLEGVFKFCNQWNALLESQGLAVRCQGVTVDGEERRGYITELSSISSYKAAYGGLTFGYSTGYTQVGVLGTYSNFTDDFFFQLYDFYVRGIYPPELVQNSDVAKDDVNGLISRLNSLVWYQHLPYYEHPKARFMWSIQNNASNDCLYPDGPTRCGIKQDFGVWSMNGFLSFVSTVKSLYPTKFGNKPHGIFQFSFVPNSWVAK